MRFILLSISIDASAKPELCRSRLTLKLHSDLHEWDLTSFVESMEDLGLPRQSHFHRKETLCLLILDYLGMLGKNLCTQRANDWSGKGKGLGKCSSNMR